MWRFLTRDMLGFGFGLWLFGYLLGVVLFAVVPLAQIGWWVTPFGLAATLLTLWKWVHVGSLRRGAALGLGWSAIAIAGDYLFIVKLLGPPDRYDKPDVYLHYLMTFALPIAAAAARSWRGRTAAWANPPSCCAAFAAKRATDLDNRGGLRKARARFAAREPAMDLAAFRASLRAVAPPAELAPAVAALCGTPRATGTARTRWRRPTRAALATGSTPISTARKATPATPATGTAAPANRRAAPASPRNGRRSPPCCSAAKAERPSRPLDFDAVRLAFSALRTADRGKGLFDLPPDDRDEIIPAPRPVTHPEPMASAVARHRAARRPTPGSLLWRPRQRVRGMQRS